MARGVAEDVENFLNGEAIIFSSFGEENKIISEKELQEGRSVSRSFNAGPIAERDFGVNQASKIFHTKNENVWGERVSLSDAS